ncbi:MAG: pyridoxamine 5'-phosphate oxidase family protein, partial [Acidimicrobiaceae bacterium]|nr:pyridoxamine 5'-phosphate oxidase family protein [Acidimicrobiaceae bacterium]
ELSESDRAFLAANRSAAMITVTPAGIAKAARIGVGLVDGKVWSSGTAQRVRTRRLRDDPRCTLFVFDGSFGFLTLETTVTLLEGPDAPALSVRLFREMLGRPTGPLSWYGAELDEEAFRQAMVDDQRLIYEFEVHRAYGMH